MGFLAVVKSLLGLSSKGDRSLVCEDCDSKFIFDAGEQKFFKEKGFTDPKRCPQCRKKSKYRSGGGRSKGRTRSKGGTRRRHSLVDGNSPYADE